jgi:hypothetical protein
MNNNNADVIHVEFDIKSFVIKDLLFNIAETR